jgi:hypothetical protein
MAHSLGTFGGKPLMRRAAWLQAERALARIGGAHTCVLAWGICASGGGDLRALANEASTLGAM